MTYRLLSKDEASPILARALETTTLFSLEVREEHCFGAESWLSLGNLCVSPSHPDRDETPALVNERAVRFGQFTWHLPSSEGIADQLEGLMGAEGKKDKALRAVREGIQDITRRLLLQLPTFDPLYVADMPFRTPTTLVADTSAILQGALDFTARFLFPMARVKIPSVVALEVLNMTDRYMAIRRSEKKRNSADSLADHIRSQGAQRALLRLEWHSDVEVERPLQGTDPLRSIFIDDKEQSVTLLNLKEVQRSYADRLVFESAKEHQSRLSANHPVSVLTSDQGLARMALSEGMRPLYFEARRTPLPFGEVLAGGLLHPFRQELYTVSLPALLWELATCFGQARLKSREADLEFRVVAISADLPWYPYQSAEDLLWCTWCYPNGAADETAEPTTVTIPTILESPAPMVDETRPAPGFITAYRFAPKTMIRLIAALAQEGELSREEAKTLAGVGTPRSFKDYESFLVSGKLAEVSQNHLRKTPSLNALYRGLRASDLDAIGACWRQVPSFSRFLEAIASTLEGAQPLANLPMRDATRRPYMVLAELSGLALHIPDQGVVLTPNKPDPEAFTEAGLRAYGKLATTDPLILSGAWLEELALHDGIHPLRARTLLQQAYDRGLLKRYFEGSTPETRFERHGLDMLDVLPDALSIKRVHLYHGDFLSPDRSSVRIKLERVTS